ncbi:hypothetical protein PR048_008824, partial [Dryococelus australis]
MAAHIAAGIPTRAPGLIEASRRTKYGSRYRVISALAYEVTPECKGEGNLGSKREIPEKTCRQTASSARIYTCENPATRPGNEPGSPWWEASVLIAQPPWSRSLLAYEEFGRKGESKKESGRGVTARGCRLTTPSSVLQRISLGGNMLALRSREGFVTSLADSNRRRVGRRGYKLNPLQTSYPTLYRPLYLISRHGQEGRGIGFISRGTPPPINPAPLPNPPLFQLNSYPSRPLRGIQCGRKIAILRRLELQRNINEIKSIAIVTIIEMAVQVRPSDIPEDTASKVDDRLWSNAGMKGRGKREIPENTRRPTASSGTIPTCENPVNRPGIEPGSPWWEASVLIAQPPWPPIALEKISAHDVLHENSENSQRLWNTFSVVAYSCRNVVISRLYVSGSNSPSLVRYEGEKEEINELRGCERWKKVGRRGSERLLHEGREATKPDATRWPVVGLHQKLSPGLPPLPLLTTVAQAFKYNTHATAFSGSRKPVRVIEVSMVQRRNEGAGETGVPRENPPTNGIVRSEQVNCSAFVAPARKYFLPCSPITLHNQTLSTKNVQLVSYLCSRTVCIATRRREQIAVPETSHYVSR